MGWALHGRDADLALLDDTLAAARTGRGHALFVTGEPGIGKSTLLAEARARAGDALVLAGAAWESGGAPPYWPWQQVIRDAGLEWEQIQPSREVEDPAAARFGLLDAVMRRLLTLAAQQPLVILLDDLHAADLPSLDLLVMLARELPRAPIALVAAWREGELAVRTDAAQRLARASRFGDVQPLRRLTADEVSAWVGADAQAIFATTEGNPLFVEETLRARRGGVAHSVASVIADHLALASEPTREVLSLASVFGREIDIGLLVQLASLDAIETALREAAAIGIVDKSERSWRFRHVLLRDSLYEAIPATRRNELHRRIGEHLEHLDAVRAAHHWLAGAAGADIERAVAVARRAAVRAAGMYAFEDALGLLELAQRSLESSPATDPLLAIDLRIEIADARHQLGQAAQARAECVKAAELARAIDDTERLARAAMTYARELINGARDGLMIALLDEAQRRLGTHDSPTRARVLARLAAAMVPGIDEPEVLRAQVIARDAVAMARRIGDAETLMFAVRFATHAHSYQITLAEAFAMSSEVIELAETLGRPLEAIDHYAWQVGANLARGNLAGASAALARCEALLAPLPQPHYRWRMPVLRAAWLVRQGKLVDAERQIAIAAELSREYGLERALWACRFATLSVIAESRDPARAAAVVEEFRVAMAPRITLGAGGMGAFMYATAGQHEAARAELATAVFFPVLVILQFSADAVVMLADRDTAVRAIPVLEMQVAKHPLVHGPQGSVFVRPAALVLGELYLLVDRVDDAIAMLENGLVLARRLEAPTAIAHGAHALSRALRRRGDTEVAAELEREAVRLAQQHDVHGIAPATAPRRSATTSDGLAIVCNGDRVRVTWNGRVIETASSKGLEFVAALVVAPGRDVHVSDLIGDDDRSNAGDVFDAKARASYKARAEELQDELEQARARNDLGRAEKLATELEAITDELLAGTGLGGRTRKTGSRVERARVNVQRRIKDAIKRLASEDESLGRYLEATIRTGTFCSYVPLGT